MNDAGKLRQQSRSRKQQEELSSPNPEHRLLLFRHRLSPFPAPRTIKANRFRLPARSTKKEVLLGSLDRKVGAAEGGAHAACCTRNKEGRQIIGGRGNSRARGRRRMMIRPTPGPRFDMGYSHRQLLEQF